MKARDIVIAAAIFAATAAGAGTWKGISPDDHYSGPKISEASLEGKVVLVDCWGVNCPPCRALLPRMEQIWKSFRHRPFVLVGSHCQGRQPEKVAALVKANKLTYPIYQGFGLAQGEPSFSGIPFLYVVNHRGKVVYAGHGEREATEAVVNALGKVDAPPSLVGEVALNHYKSLEDQLVWGKNARNALKRLAADVKRGNGKFAKDEDRAKAAEAEAILKSAAELAAETKSEIERLRESNPTKAVKLAKEFLATLPDDAAPYKAEMPAMQKKAREFEAEQKQKARERAAAGRAARRR